MMDFNRHNAEFDDLLSALTDDDISVDQMERLSRILADNSAARERYYDQLEVHSALCWELHRARPLAEAAPGCDGKLDDGKPGNASLALLQLDSDESYSAARFDRPLLWQGIRDWAAVGAEYLYRPAGFSLLLALMVVACVVISLALIPLSRRDDAVAKSDPSGESTSAAPAAFVTMCVDCQWEFGDALDAGSSLSPGRRFELARGAVEITFVSGAKAVIQAPAVVTIDSDNGASLARGRLYADVAPAAVGFTLRTPSAVVVDLGTRFAAEVDASDATEVHVTQGKVEVTPIAVADDGAPPVLLLAGMAARIDRSRTTPMPADGGRFVDSEMLHARHALLEKNLIENPGAEQDNGVRYKTNVMLSGWETPDDDTRATAQLWNGTSLTRHNGRSLPYLPEFGQNVFFGGFHGEQGPAEWAIEQRIDVAPLAESIDAGRIRCSLSGYFGGYANQEDKATLRAEFLSADGAIVGEETIGGVTPAERGGRHGLLRREAAIVAPVGARSIRLVLRFEKFSGGTNDAGADALSLELETIADR